MTRTGVYRISRFTISVENLGRLSLSLLDGRQQIVSSPFRCDLVVLPFLLLSAKLSFLVSLAREMTKDVLDGLLILDALDVVLKMISTSLGRGREGVGDGGGGGEE